MTDEDIFNADLHVLADGVRLAPRIRDGRACVRILLPASDVRLVSRVNRPCDLGINTDVRLLGVAVRRLTLAIAGETRRWTAEALRTLPGFHPAKPGEALWTAGEAHPPGAWFAGGAGEAVLEIEALTLPGYQDAGATSARNHALFKEFENLGERCDLSVAQLRFDVHPIGLLAWGSTDLPRLLAGLESGFAGLGDPAHTRLEWSEAAGEYKLRDARYLSAHTWARSPMEDAAARAAVLRAGVARLRLLARKLMADLAAPRRIYVFKAGARPLPLADFRTLHAALRRIGPVRLLCVNPGAPPERAGRVDQVGDGLFVGQVDRIVHSQGGVELWHRLCTVTARLAQATPAEQRAPADA